MTPSAARGTGYAVAVILEGPACEEARLRQRVAAQLPELQIVQWRRVQRRQPAVPSASFSCARGDLTRNGAGRHDRAGVLRLFGRDADAAALSWQLTVLREHASPERCVRYVRVPERYGYFAGHFPGYPLLPGAAQLSELVVPFARAVQPELGRLVRMARLKFQERIVPNDLIEISLAFARASDGLAAGEKSVEFALRRGERVCASGRLWFAWQAQAGAGSAT